MNTIFSDKNAVLGDAPKTSNATAIATDQTLPIVNYFADLDGKVATTAFYLQPGLWNNGGGQNTYYTPKIQGDRVTMANMAKSMTMYCN